MELGSVLLISLRTSVMASKYCSQCYSKLLLTSFLLDTDADPASRLYSTCITCREKSRKRRATARARPQRPAQRPRVDPLLPVYPLLLLLQYTNRSQARSPLPQISLARESSPEHAPPPQPPQPIRDPGFLPADQWQLIQSHRSDGGV